MTITRWPQAFDPSLSDALDIERDLATSQESGLTADEAAARLQEYGPNELVGTPPVPAWKRFALQFRDPLIYLMCAAIVISILAWILEGAAGVPIDAVVIASIVLLNAVIGFVQESKASDAVAALQEMTAASASVIRDGELRSIDARELVPGDLLVLNEGDAVGADARLCSASSLRVQEASLTGESEAVTKDPRVLKEPAGLGDRLNMVYKGTSVVQGVGRALVTDTGMATQMGAIASMLDETPAEPSPLTKEITQVSKMLGIAVVAIALTVMGVLFFVNDVRSADEAIEVLLLGVSLAVAAVPEGLPAILTVVLAIGVQRLAQHNAVVKELNSVETLGSASVIGSDKTGTLTRNEMTIKRVVTASGEVEVTGIGYAPVGEIRGLGGEAPVRATVEEAELVLAIGARANNAQLRQEHGSWMIEGDPTEASFLVAARKSERAIGLMAGMTRTGEVPFTSDRKMMSTLEVGDDGTARIMSKGAPDVLLDRCNRIQHAERVVRMTAGDRDAILASIERLSNMALRTLGVAYRGVDADNTIDEDDEHSLIWVGLVGIIDPPREEARQAIAEAHRGGIKTIMITGDHPVTAWQIASELGIPDAPTGDNGGSEVARNGADGRFGAAGSNGRVSSDGANGSNGGVRSGTQIEAMSEEELREAVESVSVYARVSPEHKRRIVDALRWRGHIVAMTGDGVNDAPALKTADIGVAMGITGTEVTKQSARMILADDNYATIVTAVRQGRSIFDNIRKFLRFLLSSNIGEIVTVFFGVVLAGVIGLAGSSGGGRLVVPLLATQILWINLVTDTFPALAMGVDPDIDDVMARGPRKSSTRIIDTKMWTDIAFTGAIMGTVSLLTLDIFLPGGLIEGHGSLEVARTAAFTTLVFTQLFNAFNSRSENTSAFCQMLSNRWLIGAIVVTVVLQICVVHLPVLQSAFSTAPLDAGQWLVAIAMASVVLWAEEAKKLVKRQGQG